MPPRFTPKIFQILLKTHKLVICVSIESSKPILTLKEETLDALTATLLRQHEENEAELRKMQRSKNPDAMDDDELELDGMGAGDELGLGMDTGGEMGLGLGTGVRADVLLADEERIPEVQTTQDFELCRGTRAKGTPALQPGGAPTPPSTFEVLKEDVTIKTALMNWESVYIQFREKSSGKLLPVHLTPYPPPPDDDDDPRARIYGEIPPTPDLLPSGSARQKRKAPSE